MKNLSEKNFLFRMILWRPVAIAEWIESSRQEKINSMVFNGVQYVIFIFAIIIIHIVFLASMTKKHEITDRYFIRLLPDTINELYEQLLLNDLLVEYDGKFLQSSHKSIQMCDKILKKLIETNKEYIDDEKHIDTTWSTIIIDDDDEHFYSQTICSEKFLILTKKLVDLCDDDEHQLAYLIAHSLSHVILKHYREPLSNLRPTQIWKGLCMIYSSRLMWIFHPNELLKEKLTNFFRFIITSDEWARDICYEKYRKMLSKMNYSETLEQETDRIAMQLLSRACFNVKRVEKFADKCHQLMLSRQKSTTESVDHDNQRQELHYIYEHGHNNDEKCNRFNDEKFMKKIIQFRHECGCDPIE
ncbi:metalloendopeptidase oma1-like protein [Dermatophagoides farinae]|uniref:Metalloendopeptidase OMA1, mitochondrial n=1 Tax=Dermatophagoides farinae TaxID=6954 RepID=A0A9D4SDG6_DERFA|nr:metalloendopeptidase oma1-like protein [Dermatophagoides farinae]